MVVVVLAAAGIPVATGERLNTMYEYRELFELQAADIIQPDICVVGGLLEMRKIAALTTLALLTLPSGAFAQGCVMCLTGAIAQGASAMNTGILVLLIPPFVMIVAILAFTFLRRSG